jgi:hypothetical protein
MRGTRIMSKPHGVLCVTACAVIALFGTSLSVQESMPSKQRC